MLRWMFVCIAVLAFGFAAFVEVSGAVHAQVAPSPLLVVATIPPAPTPLPKMLYPRELFEENAGTTDPGSITTGAASNGQGTAQPGAPGAVSPLASYGIVTVSADAANPENSYALISTPHGIDLKRNSDTEDGFRILSITERGVMFQGGIFIPVGYSQNANPSVPPVGGAVGSGGLPNTSVPVNINASPSAAATPEVHLQPQVRTTPKSEPYGQDNGLKVLPTPESVNSQQNLPGPSFIDPMPSATPPGV